MNLIGENKNPERPSVGGTQAIARAAALLREIASSGHNSCAMADLAARVGLERPTAYRILQRLSVEGLVTQDPTTRGYVLGPLLYELGLAAKPPLQLHSIATEATMKLAQDSGDTAYAIVRTGLDSLCIDRQEGDYPVKALMMNTGRRRPMGIGAGSLALLAALPAAEGYSVLQANAVRLRAAGEGNLDELTNEVERYRQQGYALRAPVEAPEILSLSIAVCNAYGAPVLALSISALKFRIEQRQALLVALLQKVRQGIQKQLLTTKVN